MSGLLETQIDREYLSEVSGGDREFEHELVQTFLETAPELIDGLAKALGSLDAKGVVHASHTLKGSARAIGAQAFSLPCEEAETSGRENDFEACKVHYLQIQANFEILRLAVQEFVAEAA